MKILVYSDLQADTGAHRLHSDPSKSLQLYCVSKFYADIKALYTQHKCSALYDLGDTFDDRTSLDVSVIDTVLAGLEWLSPSKQHKRLVGNHDQYQRDGSVHNGRVLSHYFDSVDNRQIQMMGDWAAFFVSYPASHNELTEWLQKEARRVRGPKVLFGHFQVKGSIYSGGTALTGVPAEALKPFELVLLGHIHLPQSLTPRIHYVGSPFQQDWGETNQAKRVGIFDSDALTVEWVALPGYPEYRTVSLAEFSRLAEVADEHRYKVLLSSHEETENFFRHPHFNRAVAQFNYDDTPDTAQPATEQDFSFEGACRRYLKSVAPSTLGIEMTDDEMLGVIGHIMSV